MPVQSSIVFLPVSDIQKTYHFYHEILKLPVHQKQGDSLYIFDTGYGYFGFCEYEDGRKPLSGPKGVCLSLNLNDNEEVLSKYEELKDSCNVYKNRPFIRSFRSTPSLFRIPTAIWSNSRRSPNKAFERPCNRTTFSFYSSMTPMFFGETIKTFW